MVAYRAAKHESTGFSPNKLVLGQENRAPVDIVLGVPSEERQHYSSYNEHVEYLQNRLRESYAGEYWGYTRVYAVYQSPVYFAGVYSPQLQYINRVYAGYTPCRVAYVCPNYPTSRQVNRGLGLSTSVMCQRLRLECCDASKFDRAHACVLFTR